MGWSSSARIGSIASTSLARRVAQVRTFRDLRNLAESNDWFEPPLESMIEDWQAKHGVGAVPRDDTPIDTDLAEWFMDGIIPLPEVAEDPDNDVRSWLPEEAVRLAEVGGGSPAGADWITWRDRRIGETVLEILKRHGFELIEDRERVHRMWKWPDAFEAEPPR